MIVRVVELARQRRVGACLEPLDEQVHDHSGEQRDAQDERQDVGDGLERERDRIGLAWIRDAARHHDARGGDNDERDDRGDPTDDHGAF